MTRKRPVLRSSQSLMRRYRAYINGQILRSCELLDRFERSSARATSVAKRAEIIRSCECLLTRYGKMSPPLRMFNPIDILFKDYSPREDDHSDLLAAMLDPRKKHGLGKAGLVLFMRTLLHRHEGHEECLKVSNAVEKSGERSINVSVRKRDRKSAVDITISGPDFVIGVENKRSRGMEHSTSKGPQSKNQLNDLMLTATAKHKMPLYVYIHPLTHLPTTKGAVVLDGSDLEQFFLGLSCIARDSGLRSFLSYYSDYYFRTI